MSNRSPDALVRLFREFKAAIPEADDLILSGIAVSKGGYHDSRENNERNHPGNYSIQLDIDQQGPDDCAAAIDITFKSAQASRFGTIAKYSRRLLDAYRRRDPRLFYRGERVWREFFGNADLDRQVEGWSLYHGRAASSDSSHLYHIHQSVHRKFADNWDAISGVLDILLGRPITPTPTPEDEDDMANADEIAAKLTVLDAFVREAYKDNTAKINTFEARERARDDAQNVTLSAYSGVLAEVLTALSTLKSDVAGIRAELNTAAGELRRANGADS